MEVPPVSPEQATRKSPVPVGGKKAAPPSGRHESRSPSSGRQENHLFQRAERKSPPNGGQEFPPSNRVVFSDAVGKDDPFFVVFHLRRECVGLDERFDRIKERPGAERNRRR